MSEPIPVPATVRNMRWKSGPFEVVEIGYDEPQLLGTAAWLAANIDPSREIVINAPMQMLYSPAPPEDPNYHISGGCGQFFVKDADGRVFVMQPSEVTAFFEDDV
jgi:hypothetical protein